MYKGLETPQEVALYVFDCQYIDGSALNRSILGPDADWNATNQLIAMVADHLAIANWFQTADGQKGKNRPQQIPRPGVKDETTYGKGTALSMDDMRSWLGWDK